jgi:hypothetical protein
MDDLNSKIFELSWINYEDRLSFLYFHENKTKEQFNEDVKILIIKYGEEYLNQEEVWAGVDRWIKFISAKLPELGYTLISPQRTVFGGSEIIDVEDTEWCSVVGPDLFDKAIEWNENENIRIINSEL